MNVFLKFRGVLSAFSLALTAELEQLVIRLNTWGAKEHLVTGAHGAISVTGLTFGGTTQTTVGGAGAASALPATPSGYFTVTIDGTDYVVPYYTVS